MHYSGTRSIIYTNKHIKGEELPSHPKVTYIAPTLPLIKENCPLSKGHIE